ncbi:hypothetical protein KJ965_05615 [Patescibacteria group bacterium]|nr:hypothetical protein [Patescibacteria group bacterium]
MAKHTETLLLRISPELVARLDTHVERLRAQDPDIFVSRSNTLRQLVIEGLARAEREAEVPTPSPPRPRPALPIPSTPRRRVVPAAGQYSAHVIDSSIESLIGRRYQLHETKTGWRWVDMSGKQITVEEPSVELATANLINDEAITELELTDPNGDVQVWNVERAIAVSGRAKPHRRRTKKAVKSNP